MLVFFVFTHAISTFSSQHLNHPSSHVQHGFSKCLQEILCGVAMPNTTHVTFTWHLLPLPTQHSAGCPPALGPDAFVTLFRTVV